MHSVSNDFHGHIIKKICRLHNTCVSESILSVNCAHAGIKMGNMCKPIFKSFFCTSAVSIAVTDTGKNGVGFKGFCKFLCSAKLRGTCPTHNTVGGGYDFIIFSLIKITQESFLLCTFLRGCKIWPFKMDTQKVCSCGIFIFNAVKYFYRLYGAVLIRRGNCGKNASRTVSGMCLGYFYKAFGVIIKEIKVRRTVSMYFYKPRSNVFSVRINFIVKHKSVVCYGNNFSVFKINVFIFYFSVGNHFTVFYFSNHFTSSFISALLSLSQ